MNEDPTELEDRVRELILGGHACRPELNELLRTQEAARPVAARLLVEDAALIAVLRVETVAKWAGNLQPRTVDETTDGLGSPKSPKTRRMLALGLAAAVCLAAAGLTFVKTRKKPAGSVAPAVTEVVIGIVTPLNQDARGLPAAKLLEQGVFSLDSGQARIDLDNGVVLSVAGPARLSINLDHCRLLFGDITIDAPRDLGTYVVETDDERFADLGQSFSVSVQPGKHTELEVLPAPARMKQMSGGDADHPAPEPGKPQSETSGRPVSQPPGPPAPLLTPLAYRAAVTSSAPFLVWDFEDDLLPSGFHNRIGPSFPGRIHGRIRQSSAQGGNRHIVLGENEEDGWIESPDSWEKDDASPFTIELWARPDRIHWGHLLNLRSNHRIDPVTGREPGGPLSYFSLEMTHTRDFLPLPPGPAVRTTFRSPATEHPLHSPPGGLNVDLASPQRYLPGVWHHLVARVDRREFTLFVNGQPATRQAIAVPRFGDIKLGLRVGALFQRGRSQRQFVGAIDEIAIYGRALSDSEIARHFQAAGTER